MRLVIGLSDLQPVFMKPSVLDPEIHWQSVGDCLVNFCLSIHISGSCYMKNLVDSVIMALRILDLFCMFIK